MLDEVRIPVDQTKIVQTQGRSQSTHEHTTESQTILIGLLVRCQVVNIEDLHVEDSVECADREVTY